MTDDKEKRGIAWDKFKADLLAGTMKIERPRCAGRPFIMGNPEPENFAKQAFQSPKGGFTAIRPQADADHYVIIDEASEIPDQVWDEASKKMREAMDKHIHEFLLFGRAQTPLIFGVDPAGVEDACTISTASRDPNTGKLTLDLLMEAKAKLDDDKERRLHSGVPFGHYGGIQFFYRTSEPEYAWVPRTWRERLFTRPWQPFVTTKRVDFPEAAERNRQIWVTKDGHFITRELWLEIKREADKKGHAFSMTERLPE